MLKHLLAIMLLLCLGCTTTERVYVPRDSGSNNLGMEWDWRTREGVKAST